MHCSRLCLEWENKPLTNMGVRSGFDAAANARAHCGVRGGWKYSRPGQNSDLTSSDVNPSSDRSQWADLHPTYRSGVGAMHHNGSSAALR